jgi:hypothetical protein
LKRLHTAAVRAWYKWLNRRGSPKALTWERFNDILVDFPLPAPRIVVTIWASSP